METDGEIDAPQQWEKRPTRVTSVAIDYVLHDEAKRENISLKDATEFGIRFLIADRDGIDYPKCKLQEKLEKVIAHRNSLLHQIELSKTDEDVEEVKVVSKEQIEKEVDEVFGGLIK